MSPDSRAVSVGLSLDGACCFLRQRSANPKEDHEIPFIEGGCGGRWQICKYAGLFPFLGEIDHLLPATRLQALVDRPSLLSATAQRDVGSM